MHVSVLEQRSHDPITERNRPKNENPRKQFDVMLPFRMTQIKIFQNTFFDVIFKMRWYVVYVSSICLVGPWTEPRLGLGVRFGEFILVLAQGENFGIFETWFVFADGGGKAGPNSLRKEGSNFANSGKFIQKRWEGDFHIFETSRSFWKRCEEGEGWGHSNLNLWYCCKPGKERF